MSYQNDTIDWQAIHYIDAWLDGYVSDDYKNQPLAQDWARTGKVIEELGESIERLIKFTGRNPRKPIEDREAERSEFLIELADTAITAILCMAHFTKDPARVRQIIMAKLATIHERAVTEIRKADGQVLFTGTEITETETSEAELAVRDFPVRTICGSLRYYKDMLIAAQKETTHGVIILMPHVADYAFGQMTDERKRMLDEMHLAKIDMSSAIIVVGTHIGESTTNEIKYAIATGKEVLYWTDHFGAIA